MNVITALSNGNDSMFIISGVRACCYKPVSYNSVRKCNLAGVLAAIGCFGDSKGKAFPVFNELVAMERC